MERYNEYKDSGIQWIGDIPSHWAAVPFKSMFSLQKGLTITKDDLTDEGIKVISYGQIHSKSNKFTYIVDDLYRYVPAHYLESNSNSLSEIGDFMFADTSEDVVGCGNFVRVDTEDKLFAGYHTIIGKIKDRECSKYLSYLFQADEWRCQIWIKVDGVKLFSISRKILNSTKIILPPLSEQTAIVAYLDTQTSRIDSFIANVEREIELLGEAKQRIIADAATKGLKKDVEMRDSGVEWLGEIPAHWKKEQLRKYIKIVSIKNHPEKQLLSVTREQGVIVRNKESKEENHNFIPDDLSGYKYVQEGQFVINKMKSWQGSYDVSKYEGIVSPAYYVCDLRFPNKDFFRVALRSKAYIGFFTQYSKGIRVGQWDLDPIALKSIPFFEPPIEEQLEIVDFISQKTSQIDTLISSLSQQIASLKEYKQRLISDVVTGQIKIC